MAKRKSQSKQKNERVDPWKWAQTYLTPVEVDKLRTSLENELPISIRINQLKSNPKIFIKELKRMYGWTSSAVPYCESGYWIKESEPTPSKTIEHRMGYYYIQEAASMLPAEMFDFKDTPHPLVLDMAASPGGKTTHLIDQTMDKGLVIANDSSRSRMNALRIVLQNWGAINQAVTNMPGEWYGHAYPETFDAVLLDAPCSMQGMHASASHSIRAITENDVDMLAETQFQLLKSALSAAKIGGQVVYSTCTLSPLENEAVVARILETFGEAVALENIQTKLPKAAPSVRQFNGISFPDTITHAVRLWPHVYGTAGFFCAKLIKKDTLITDNDLSLWSGNAKLGGSLLEETERIALCKKIGNLYGFDLENIVKNQNLGIWKQADQTYLVPARLFESFPALPMLSMGMLAGINTSHGWEPSHEFVSRFGDQFTDNVYILDDTHLATWLRGADIRGIDGGGALIGKILAIRDAKGRNLGRGGMQAKRLKNMLPHRIF
jgi:16S rRNA (cytosine1407-C5)-methyltransferase